MLKVRRNSPEEEGRINADIAGDPDAPVPTDEEFARARRTRGVQAAPTKERIGIRLDADVVEHFRRTGGGWQSRLNETLRKAIGL